MWKDVPGGTEKEPRGPEDEDRVGAVLPTVLGQATGRGGNPTPGLGARAPRREPRRLVVE